MAWMSPEYQAWMQTVRQQNAAYDQKIQGDLQGATYQQAAGPPRLWGNSPLTNALTQRAGPPNNSATALFSGTPYDLRLQAYLDQMSQPGMGGSTIGMPGGNQVAGNQVDWSNPLLSQLLRGTGVG